MYLAEIEEVSMFQGNLSPKVSEWEVSSGFSSYFSNE